MSVSIAQRIHFLSLLSNVFCSDFRHEIVAKAFQVANVATPQTIFTFTVPKHQSWFITQIDLEAYNPNTVGSSPLAASDFRSDQFDWNGLTNAWLVVNQNPIMGVNTIPSSAVFNRPLLIVLKGGDKLEIVIERDAASLPAAAFEVQVVVDGFFAPATAFSTISVNTTNIQAGS